MPRGRPKKEEVKPTITTEGENPIEETSSEVTSPEVEKSENVEETILIDDVTKDQAVGQEAPESELSIDDLAKDPEPTKPETAETKKNSGSHLKFGDDGYQEMLKQEKLNQARKEKSVRRFYLSQEEGKNEGVIVFLDNPRAYTWEHEIDTSGDGSWKSRAYLSCVKDNDSCEVCGDSHKSYYVCYGSVFDTRKYIKDGQQVMQGKSLFGAKKQTMHKIRDLIKEYGDLRGLAFKVKRYPGSKEPKVGSDFKYLGKVDVVKQFGKEDSTPFDYNKILARPTPEELQAYGIKSVTFGSDADLSKTEGLDISFL